MYNTVTITSASSSITLISMDCKSLATMGLLSMFAISVSRLTLITLKPTLVQQKFNYSMYHFFHAIFIKVKLKIPNPILY